MRGCPPLATPLPPQLEPDDRQPPVGCACAACPPLPPCRCLAALVPGCLAGACRSPAPSLLAHRPALPSLALPCPAPVHYVPPAIWRFIAEELAPHGTAAKPAKGKGGTGGKAKAPPPPPLPDSEEEDEDDTEEESE